MQTYYDESSDCKTEMFNYQKEFESYMVLIASLKNAYTAVRVELEEETVTTGSTFTKGPIKRGSSFLDDYGFISHHTGE
jgi:hypothetical protein